MSAGEKIRAYLADQRAAQTRFLADLVKVPSDNPPGDCRPHAERAGQLLEALVVLSHAVAFVGGKTAPLFVPLFDVALAVRRQLLVVPVVLQRVVALLGTEIAPVLRQHRQAEQANEGFPRETAGAVASRDHRKYSPPVHPVTALYGRPGGLSNQ